MRRTAPKIEERVLKGILSGMSYKKIQSLTGVPVSTIKNIKFRHKNHIEDRKYNLIEDNYINSRKVLAESYAELSRILGDSRSGVTDLSVNDLIAISKEMHTQSTTSSPQGPMSNNLQKLVQKYQ